MNILFVCKYNKFRSQIAESYFKKINKNKKIKAVSRGIFVGRYPLDKLQVAAAKKLGIAINSRPKPITTKLLRKQDLIIIVADNVPRSLFIYKGKYPRKTISWGIPDEQNDNKERTEKVIKRIKKKVEELVEQLKGEK